MDNQSQQNPQRVVAHVERVEISVTWAGGGSDFPPEGIGQPVSVDFLPPPRKIRRVYGLFSVSMQRLLLVVALTLAGLGVKYPFEFAMVHAFGQPIAARVTNLEKRQIKKDFEYWVYYAFDSQGRTYTGSTTLSASSWNKLHIGGPVQVKTLKLGSTPWYEVSVSALDSVHPELIWATLFFSLVIFGLMYISIVLPLRHARLLRLGNVVQGTVMKVEKNSRVDEQTVAYVYGPQAGQTHCGKTTGRKSLWPTPGNQVAIFYDPRRPGRSVAFGCCCFEIVR